VYKNSCSRNGFSGKSTSLLSAWISSIKEYSFGNKEISSNSQNSDSCIQKKHFKRKEHFSAENDVVSQRKSKYLKRDI